MVRNINIFCFFLITILSSLLIGNYCVLRKKDYKKYNYFLLKKKKNKMSFQKNALQERENVQKDLWTSDKERLHFRLYSDKSHLSIFLNKNKKLQVEEKMENISCWLQDQVQKNPTSQQIRFFTADNGIYTYPSHRFVSSCVNLYFLYLMGNALPDTIKKEDAYINGYVKEFSFIMPANHIPKCHASHINASISGDKKYE